MTSAQQLATARHLPLTPIRSRFDFNTLCEDLCNPHRPQDAVQQQFIHDRLLKLTEIAKVGVNGKNARVRIANEYVKSHDFLNAQYEASNRFFEGLVDSQIEHRGEFGSPKWAEAVSKTRTELLQRISYRLPSAPSILTAELGAIDTPEYLSRLQLDINSRVATLSSHYFKVLFDASKQRIVGHLNWTGPDTCQYVYFTAPIICEGTVTSRRVLRTKIRTTQTTIFQHRFGVHVHDVMNAEVLHGLPPEVLLPARVERFVRTIPDIVRPLLAVVDGFLISERVVEWDAFKSTIVEERVEPQVSIDPAIVIGPYVLVGWTDRDFESGPIGDKALRWAARSWMKLTR